MLERFSNVVYWLFSLMSALTVLFGGLISFTARQDNVFLAVVTLLVATALYLIGRAIRYVLVGK